MKRPHPTSQGPLTELLGTHPLLQPCPELSWLQSPWTQTEGLQGFIGFIQACGVSVGLGVAPVICLMSSLVGLQGPWAVGAASFLPSLMTSAVARRSRDLVGSLST